MALDPVLGWADPVRLRDGRSVLIRPAHRSDAELVQAFVRGLSSASRYQRFFLAFRELSPSLLDLIVEADQQHAVSLLALTAHDDALTAYDDSGVAVVGLAQYGVDRGSDAAEVAVVVGERWRHAGLATRMLLDLAELAAGNGLEQFQAEILKENTAALRLAAKLDASIGRGSAGANVVRVSRQLTAAQPSGRGWPRSDAGSSEAMQEFVKVEAASASRQLRA